MPISRGGTTGISFCHQTDGLISGRSYNRDFMVWECFLSVDCSILRKLAAKLIKDKKLARRVSRRPVDTHFLKKFMKTHLIF